MFKFIWIAVVVGVIGTAIYVLFMLGLWYNVTRSAGDSNRKPECNIHEKSRISFSIADAKKKIDSFKVAHPEYEDSLAITDNHGDINSLSCCCIDYHIVIVFNKSPQEIYTLDFGENEHSGFIDIVSTNRNGIWHPVLTSKLEGKEKHRIKLRFNNEVLSKLSMIKHK
jgi:hypothetical protein